MTKLKRPGFFGRRRDEIVKQLDIDYGKGKWALRWCLDKDSTMYDFERACKLFYEESYVRYFAEHMDELKQIAKYAEVIDNAETNVQSGCDYSIQEAYSTHIQDIAIRNVVKLFGYKFTGEIPELLVVRSKDSTGYKWGPGNIPFWAPTFISKPSLVP